jgi:hypothetical protein
MKTNLPNFLIIGAAKSGTSALYRYIRQHPSIFMSPLKEPHFFGFENAPPNTQGPKDYVNNAITNISDYKKLFANVTTETAIGEASPTYLQLPRAVERIYHYIPNVKLIAILRQPADRAFSAYMHVVRDQRETAPTFQEGLRREQERITANWGSIWHYTKAGHYYPQLKRYYDCFSPQQIRVYLHDDFVANPLTVIYDIFNFLEVDNSFIPYMQLKANVSGVQKSRLYYFLTNTLFNKPNPIRYIARHIIPEETRWRFTTNIRNRNLIKQAIPSDVRAELTEKFRPDILKLEQLIDRDLSHWLT